MVNDFSAVRDYRATLEAARCRANGVLMADMDSLVGKRIRISRRIDGEVIREGVFSDYTPPSTSSHPALFNIRFAYGEIYSFSPLEEDIAIIDEA